MSLKVHFKKYQKWQVLFVSICLMTIPSLTFFTFPKITAAISLEDAANQGIANQNLSNTSLESAANQGIANQALSNMSLEDAANQGIANQNLSNMSLEDAANQGIANQGLSDTSTGGAASQGCALKTIDSTPNEMTVPVSQLESPEYVAAQNRAYTEYYKICVADPQATIQAKKTIKALTDSAVQWIDNGFTGNPVFVQNPEKFFNDLTDTVASNAIENVSQYVASPFQSEITSALASDYTGQNSNQALGSTLADPQSDYQTFSEGTVDSWDKFYQITQIPQNNIYGASMLARDTVQSAVATAQAKYKQQLDWGRGYFSLESCPADSSGNSQGNPVYDQNDQPVYGVYVDNSGCVIKTPGATIQDQLDSILSSDLSGLEVAQTVDQVYPQLEGQLMQETMGGSPDGLDGADNLSNSNSSSYSPSNPSSGSSFNIQDILKFVKSLAGSGGSSSGGSTGNSSNSNPTGSGSTGGSTSNIPAPILAITGTCSPSSINVQIGATVTWNAHVTPLYNNLAYTWYGENLSSDNLFATTSYASNGTKTAGVIVMSTGANPQWAKIDCSPNLVVGNVNSASSTATI